MRAARRAGPRVALERLREKASSTQVFLGLRADLAQPAAGRPARIAVSMVPVAETAFAGFRRELEATTGAEHLEALVRHRLCEAGVRELYVAFDGDDPIYAQWCVAPADRGPLDAFAPGYYAPAADGEVLLEGAYTFTRFRGQGAMADGMSQLARIAAAAGFGRALTYVAIDNVPSLRGCAAAGFYADHVRVDRWRLGRRTSTFGELSPAARERYERATAPRR